MPVVYAELDFNSDLNGLVEQGLSPTTIAFLSTDGSPSSGCCRVTLGGGPSAAVPEYARKATTTDTFETWGVPSGGVVSSLEIVSANGKQAGSATITGQFYVRAIDENGVSIHGTTVGTDDLISENIATFGSSWASTSLGGAKAVDSAKSASTQRVRWELQADVGIVTGSCDFRFDTPRLAITYTGGSGGGGGGGTGGSTGSGTSSDLGQGMSLMTGGGVTPTADCGNEFDINNLNGIDFDKASAYTWFHENRLYLSMGRRTLVYDTQIAGGGWSDAGYGNVRQGLTVQVPNHEQWMFLLMPGPLGGNAFNFVAYTSQMLKPGMNNVVNVGNRQAFIGPFDGMGPDRESVKRGVRLRVWGEYDNPVQSVPQSLGTLTMYSDTGYSETYPIVPLARAGYATLANPPRRIPPGMIVEQMFRTAMRGRVLWGFLDFTAGCVSVRDQMLEYVRTEAMR